MPNKDIVRQTPEVKVAPMTTVQATIPKTTVTTVKASTGKTMGKETAMSPGASSPNIDAERTELLGSLTTQQQQRTSARVIKKLKLETPAEKRSGKRPDGTDDIPDCETPNKIDDKDPLKFPTVKQRMPKALWSTDEKNLFFEALNEYGKDFDAITAHICAKMKKKGMPDVNLKTKTQVSHFYYRTWHKLSKHVHFDENVKKVAQELYALINYGELRKKLVSVNEKTCARLSEMVLGGSMVVRARGKNVRVRTPMCRALRRLNQITERACGSRVCSRAQVCLRARDAGAWARVQAAAHNPRLVASLPLRTPLHSLIYALQKRWGLPGQCKREKAIENIEQKSAEDLQKETDDLPELQRCDDSEDKLDAEDHLQLEADRIIVQEQKLSKKPALHVGPPPGVEIHLPVVSPSEQLSSHKICLSSYLERMQTRHNDVKIRTPKRQRKDSTSEKDKEDAKKLKTDDLEPNKLINIEETAIDGIELMANYKNNQEDEEKPSTEDEKEMKSEETAEEDMPDRDKDMSEREKDSFSEMEDDEKYNKSDTDNESDHGKVEKRKERKFKNLKVKFRIRPKKRGGSIYTLVIEKEDGERTAEESKLEEDKMVDPQTALNQVRKGWSVHDAGDLTIGDLYLMFGSRSKLQLDYWWAEPTPPLPLPQKPKPAETEKTPPLDKDKPQDKKERENREEDEKEKARESDNEMMSPKNTFSQDSNDGLSGDEKKSEQLSSPDHKSGSSSLKLMSKLINRPTPPPAPDGFSLLSDRLKRLLALVGNSHVSPAAAARCNCGHVCAQHRKQKQSVLSSASQKTEENSVVFRHPTPIAPRPEHENGVGGTSSSCESTGWRLDIPRRPRGRPRAPARRVVVQRLLPLLPKLPPPSNLIPVKIVPNSPPAPPRILPKPPPTSTSDLSLFYVLSESNGQFFFHDGDRRIPITPLTGNNNAEHNSSEEDVKQEQESSKEWKSEAECSKSADTKDESSTEPSTAQNKPQAADIANFLPSESMSLSPSRLLRDSDGWLEGAVQDFSLSSFLQQLEGKPPDLAVDSQLHSLMAESSVDYVAKFADLAAEVTDEANPLEADNIKNM